MSQQWKQMERNVGLLTETKRYPANQGGRIDTEGPKYITQCKERKSLSLEQVTQLVEEIEQLGKEKGKIGLLALKARRGSGRYSPILIVQTIKQWKESQG